MTAPALVLAVVAVVLAVVDPVDWYLGAVVAVEPVDRVAVFVVLRLVATVLAVLLAVVDPVEWYLLAVSADEGTRTGRVSKYPHRVVVTDLQSVQGQVQLVVPGVVHVVAYPVHELVDARVFVFLFF